MAMDVTLNGFKGHQATAPAALDDMAKVSLPFLLESAAGAALFVLDGALIDGLIEQQLLGDVLPTERLDRPVTKIDAGLSEGFVKNAVSAISAEASGQLSGLQLNRVEQDRAALRLALGEGQYDILEAHIDMGPGIKTGRFELWVPAIKVAKARGAKSGINAGMLEVMQSCEIELDAWLDGCSATAQTLMGLEVGTVLSVPRSALAQVAIRDCNGNPFAQAKLGQLNGFRAVRLTRVHSKVAGTSVPKAVADGKPTTAIALTEPASKQTAAKPDPEFEDVSDGALGNESGVEGKALTG